MPDQLAENLSPVWTHLTDLVLERGEGRTWSPRVAGACSTLPAALG